MAILYTSRWFGRAGAHCKHRCCNSFGSQPVVQQRLCRGRRSTEASKPASISTATSAHAVINAWQYVGRLHFDSSTDHARRMLLTFRNLMLSAWPPARQRQRAIQQSAALLLRLLLHLLRATTLVAAHGVGAAGGWHARAVRAWHYSWCASVTDTMEAPTIAAAATLCACWGAVGGGRRGRGARSCQPFAGRPARLSAESH